MVTELLDVPSELLIGSTETMRRALQRPATQTLSQLDAKDLLRHSRYVLSRLTAIFHRSQKALTSGVEGSMFSQVCDRMKEVIEPYLDLNRDLAKMIRQQPPSVRQRQLLASLKQIEEEADRILQSYKSWSAAFGRPSRPIDWTAVAEAEAAHARGENRRVNDFELDLEMRGGQ
jgi:hypothetical protein